MYFPQSPTLGGPLDLCAVIGALFGMSTPAQAQDSVEAHLPDSARIALRAKPGDLIKMLKKQTETTHIHLEQIASEFSEESTDTVNKSYEFRGSAPNGAMTFEYHDTEKSKGAAFGGDPTKTITTSTARIVTVKPNLDVVKTHPLERRRKASLCRFRWRIISSGSCDSQTKR